MSATKATVGTKSKAVNSQPPKKQKEQKSQKELLKEQKEKKRASAVAQEVTGKKAKNTKEKVVEVVEVKSSKKTKAVVKEEAASLVHSFMNYDDMMDGIEKKYDTGSSQLAVDTKAKLSIGLLTLDLVLSGGILGGGWYTFFGQEQSAKSTLAMQCVIACVNSDTPIVGYFDYEGSSSPDYIENMMKSMNVKGDIQNVFGLRDASGQWAIKPRVRYYQPTTAEAFFDSVAKLLRSLPDIKMVGDRQFYVYPDEKQFRAQVKGQYDEKLLKKTGMLYVETEKYIQNQALFIVDSYPAMLPEKQDEDDPGSAMAVQARMFSEQIKRIKSKLKPKKVTVVGINQLRLRPMVTYGCFYYTSPVLLADGTTEHIGKIVSQRLPVEVLSFNPKTNKYEPKKVVNWFNNGNAEEGEFIKLKVQAGSRNGLNHINCTRNHLLLEYKGEMKHAGDFKVGEYLTTPTTIRPFSPDQKQILYGSILGDGSLSICGSKVRIRFLQGKDQRNYLTWKYNRFKIYGGTCGEHKESGGLWYDTSALSNPNLLKLAEQNNCSKFGDRTYNGLPKEVVKKLDLRGLSIWYMDDGTFYDAKGKGLDNNWTFSCEISCSRFSDLQKEMLCKRLNKLTKLNWKFSGRGIYLSTKPEIKSFHKQISEYMLKGFEYKLYKQLDTYGSYEWSDVDREEKLISTRSKIVEIEDFEPYGAQSKGKFDLEIEDNHNYIVSNCVVHNSPEYEPCFVGKTPVLLADGTTDTIRRIVEEKRDVKVMSFCKETGIVSEKRILDWKYNGTRPAADFCTIIYSSTLVDAGGKKILGTVTCTKDHKIWTTTGWLEARKLVEGDSVYIGVVGGILSELLVLKVTNYADMEKDVELFDLTIEDNHTYFVGGLCNTVENATNIPPASLAIAVSNCGEALKLFSDARIRCASRSIPHGKGQLEEEPSVTGEGVDVYRYVNWRAIKNKLGAPNLEGWGRIHVADSEGKGRGFDPVWDTYQYLLMTGQISGTRNKLVCTLPQFVKLKTRLTWMQFKTLVLGNKEQISKTLKKLGYTDKNFSIRKECFKQFASGKSMDMYFEKKKNTADVSEGDED